MGSWSTVLSVVPLLQLLRELLTGSFAASSCSIASNTTGAGTAPGFATHDLITLRAESVSTDAVSSREDSTVQLSQSVLRPCVAARVC